MSGGVVLKFEITEERMRELNELKRILGLKSNKDLFNNALTLLEWAVKERKQGRIIASVDSEGKKYKEIILPCLEYVAPKK